MNRIFGGLAVLLAIASCRDKGSSPGIVVATGGAGGGAGPSAGSGGATSSGGATGSGIDASDDRISDGGNADGAFGGHDAAEGGRPLEPIRVSGGNPDASVAYHDLRFIGAGLEQYEGDVVTFRIGTESLVWRRGFGQVRIVQGAFDVLFEQVVAPIYEQKLAHIDTDGNGMCDVGEPAFSDQALLQTDITLTVTPADIRFRPAALGWCNAINNWSIP